MSKLKEKDRFGQKLKNILINTATIMFGRSLDVSARKVFVTEELLSRIFDFLICSDIDQKTTSQLISKIREKMLNSRTTAKAIRQEIYDEIYKIIKPLSYPIDIDYKLEPQVVIVCGINGSGKTTTVGKMAYMLSKYKWKVSVAICDTTRKSTSNQLRLFCNDPDLHIISANPHNYEKPKSIARRAMIEAQKNNSNILLIDTPGYTEASQNSNLKDTQMIVDVVSEIDPTAPHNVVAVIDANNGQNAIDRILQTKTKLEISGAVVTKLDATSKAGMVVSAINRIQIPIHGIGIGTGVEDLQDFSPEEFIEGLSSFNLQKEVK